MKKIDITSILGVIIAIGGIFSGFVLEGGHLGALIAVSPIAIIFGGTFGAVIITQPWSVLKQMPGILKSVFADKEYDYNGLIEQLIDWAKVARQKGFMELQKSVSSIDDPFVKRGIEMVIDSTDPEYVKEFLDNDINSMMDRHNHNAAIFEAAGGYSPTMGIIGTILGLITVLSKLGNGSAADLGEGIATAFLATFMGISFANIIALPFGGKLRSKSEKEVLYRTIAMYGIIAIQAQESPIYLEQRLKSLLSKKMREKGEVK